MDSLRHRHRLVLTLDIGDEDGELVAPEAGHRVARANGSAEAVSDLDQQTIAGLVAIAVVDQLVDGATGDLAPLESEERLKRRVDRDHVVVGIRHEDRQRHVLVELFEAPGFEAERPFDIVPLDRCANDSADDRSRHLVWKTGSPC